MVRRCFSNKFCLAGCTDGRTSTHGTRIAAATSGLFYPWDLGRPALDDAGTLLKDPIDGRFKGWVTSWASDVPEVLGQKEYRICYIESKDGVTWERLMLDLWPREEYPKTNILFDFPVAAEVPIHRYCRS